MTAYYNENEPFAAAWLRNLIAAEHIAPGEVDERSIEDVRPDDLRGYDQCHFFAGIGVWSHALRGAGWPDNRPVWTGSCPCQPFSAAGKGGGFADERHLWPAFFHLIRECRPAVVIGEQVASKDGLGWLDLVSADMEGADYAFGAVDSCAAGYGAPHIRQRLYWLAHAHDAGLAQRSVADVGRGTLRDEGTAPAARLVSGGLADSGVPEAARQRQHRGEILPVAEPEGFGFRGYPTGGLADTDRAGRCEGRRDDPAAGHGAPAAPARGLVGVADAERLGRERGRAGETSGRGPLLAALGPCDAVGRPGPTNGLWRDADWLLCRDGKWRPVESGAQQMADGIARGLGLLRPHEAVASAVKEAAASEGVTREILREMRDGNDAPSVWRSLGGRYGFPQAAFLLAVLCQQSRELGGFFHCAPSGLGSDPEGILRELPEDREAARPSPGRGHAQQRAEELGDALSLLPQVGALDILADFTGAPLSRGSFSRVGRLRAYGNAIVAPQATAFVEAAQDILFPAVDLRLVAAQDIFA